jgi:hypothetical protein
MASNFPTSLDNFSNPTTGDKLDSPSHAGQHGDANDAIEGLEIKLGIGASSAGSATAGFPLVHSSGGTTAWAQVGYQGITSGTASSGQVLTAGTATGSSIWSTPSVAGLTQIVPTSVAVGSGSGSVDANGAVTFSAASSISINGCFSSTYDNYRIVFYNSVPTSSSQSRIRFRRSNADITSSNYLYVRHLHRYYNAVENYDAEQIITTSVSIDSGSMSTGGTYNQNFIIDLYNPLGTNNLKTAFCSTVGYWDSPNLIYAMGNTGMTLIDNTNALSGITFFYSTGNIARCKAKLYGLK